MTIVFKINTSISIFLISTQNLLSTKSILLLHLPIPKIEITCSTTPIVHFPNIFSPNMILFEANWSTSKNKIDKITISYSIASSKFDFSHHWGNGIDNAVCKTKNSRPPIISEELMSCLSSSNAKSKGNNYIVHLKGYKFKWKTVKCIIKKHVQISEN